MEQREHLRAFTLLSARDRSSFQRLSSKQRERLRAFTLLSRHSSLVTRHAAFTLLELLVVIAIIAIMLVAVIPVVNSLSKSSGRKGAISLLLGTLEQGRSLAIKDGRNTYVVFPAEYPAGTAATTDQNIVSRYFYHSVGIFEDDVDPTKPNVQVTEWKVLPTGVSLRSDISDSGSSSKWTGASFAFAPTKSSPTFPFIKFNASGQIESPTPTNNQVQLRVFEGYVSGSSEHVTSSKNFDESITITTVSGRAIYTSANP